jgi:hypothetical protein
MACDPAVIDMIGDEMHARVDWPKDWELEARTVEQCLRKRTKG